jgi:hypothetical protein
MKSHSYRLLPQEKAKKIKTCEIRKLFDAINKNWQNISRRKAKAKFIIFQRDKQNSIRKTSDERERK